MSLVQAEIFTSGFFAHPEAVSILSGSDEGIYSWLTLNLLLKALHFSAGLFSTSFPFSKISSPL